MRNLILHQEHGDHLSTVSLAQQSVRRTTQLQSVGTRGSTDVASNLRGVKQPALQACFSSQLLQLSLAAAHLHPRSE